MAVESCEGAIHVYYVQAYSPTGEHFKAIALLRRASSPGVHIACLVTKTADQHPPLSALQRTRRAAYSAACRAQSTQEPTEP